MVTDECFNWIWILPQNLLCNQNRSLFQKELSSNSKTSKLKF